MCCLRAGLLPTELTGMWGWILLRSPPQGRGSAPAPAPTQQRPVEDWGPYRKDDPLCRPLWANARSLFWTGMMRLWWMLPNMPPQRMRCAVLCLRSEGWVSPFHPRLDSLPRARSEG